MENNSFSASARGSKFEDWIRMAELDVKIVEFIYTGIIDNTEEGNKTPLEFAGF